MNLSLSIQIYYHYLYLLLFLSFTLKSLIYFIFYFFIFKSPISLHFYLIFYLSLSSILNFLSFLSLLSLTFFKFYIYNLLSLLLFSCLKIRIYICQHRAIRRERNKEKRENTKFNMVQHTMYVPTSTATLRELFITCTYKSLQGVSIYNTNETQVFTNQAMWD